MVVVIAMKKQKKPLSDSAIKFKKKVELREEIFINSLQEQRAKMSDFPSLPFYSPYLAFPYITILISFQ